MKKLMDAFGAVFLGFCLVFSFLLSDKAGAVSYQNNINVHFNFATNLTVSLSSKNLVIESLAPGQSANSNGITIGVSSNNPTGLSLTATVGSSTYNTTNLVNASSGSSYFNSVLTGSSSESLSSGEWGFSVNSGSTYSGLPLYTNSGAVLYNSNVPASSSVNFLIGAKATASQSSGDYRNVINFLAVANAVTEIDFATAFATAGKTMVNGYYKMQDMTPAICDMVTTATTDADAEEMQLIDVRDYKPYWVAKLKDGHCWMTQNLDLDLYNTKTYTHYDTDLGWALDGGVSNASATFTPVNNTIQTGEDELVFEWENSYTVPYSFDAGEKYLTGENGGTLSTSPDATYGMHGHVGNYYNWTAAIASNDSSSYDGNQVADNSICPAGWRLPLGNGTNSSAYIGSDYSEFSELFYNYGIISSLTAGSSSLDTQKFSKLAGKPLYYVRGGSVDSGSLNNITTYGNYWSSVVSSNNSNSSRFMHFGSGSLNPKIAGSRYPGLSVRCMVPYSAP